MQDIHSGFNQGWSQDEGIIDGESVLPRLQEIQSIADDRLFPCSLPDGLRNLEWETDSVLETSTVFIGPLV